jgi:uncharacterized protein (TIGR00255 family)
MAKVSGMTGFARAQSSGDFGALSVEVRSVNGKGLDARLRLPPGFDEFEALIREKIKSTFNRGSIQLSLSFEPAKNTVSAQVDEQVLQAYAKAAQELNSAGQAQPATAGELLSLKGVLVAADGVDAETISSLEDPIGEIVDLALSDLENTRLEEGQAMATVLVSHLDEIESLRAEAADSAEALPHTIRDRLKAKLDDLLPGGLDPDRLEQEAALLALKADIREELDRLKAHGDSARALIKGGSPCGRKLDFLTQEFNREANTLCSKAADSALTRLGLDLKAVVDRLREQVQNVE